MASSAPEPGHRSGVAAPARGPAPGARHRRASPLRPEINVTPLVDVVLVLLIIFMVIAPQLEEGVRVETPGVSHPDPKVKTDVKPITLTVTVDERLYLDKTEIPLDQLEAQLGATAEPKRRLLLKGDVGLRYGLMRTVFRRSQAVGFPGISLVVGERNAPAEGRGREGADGL